MQVIHTFQLKAIPLNSIYLDRIRKIELTLKEFIYVLQQLDFQTDTNQYF